jgi:hypothetical protein
MHPDFETLDTLSPELAGYKNRKAFGNEMEWKTE